MEPSSRPSLHRHRLQTIHERIDGLWEAYRKRSIYEAVHGYQPLRGQRAFHLAPGQLRLLLGGNRSGKTMAGAAEAVWHAMGQYPDWYPEPGRTAAPNRGWIVGLDYSMVRDVIEPAVRHFLDDAWIHSWNANTHVIRLINGSTIGLKSADSGRSKFQGASRHWIWMDEETPEDIFQECRARIVDVSGRMWMTLTPLRGLMYVKRLIRDAQADPHVDVLYAATRDNARSTGGVIPDHEIERFAAQLSPAEARCRLEGHPPPVEGRAYPSFVSEKHVVPSLEFSPHRDLLWSWDFNVSPLCSVLAQVEGTELRVVDEVVLDGPHGHTTDEAVQAFLERYGHASQHGVKTGAECIFRGDIILYGDYAGMARSHRRSGNDYELIRQILERAGWPRPAIRVRPNPAVRERVQSVERLLGAQLGRPRISISKQCQYLIDDLEQVRWDRTGHLDKRQDPQRTHSSDALGYLVAERFPLVPFRRESDWVPPW